MQPAQGSLNPAIFSETTAVGRVPLGEDRLDAPSPQDLTMGLGIIAPVTLHPLGTVTRMAHFAPHGGNRLDQRHELGYIMRIGSGQDHREWDPAAIGDDVMLTARFAFIRGIRACFFPPCTARTEALSTTARDQSI
jgi:hypothetical protein